MRFNKMPLRAPKRDSDGDIIWKNRELAEPELESATVRLLLREAILQKPRSIDAQNDGVRSAQLWNQVERSKDGVIELKEPVYDWVHRLLNREVKPTPQEKEQGIEAMPYARRLWGTDWWLAVNSLKDIDSRQDPDTVEPAGDDAKG